MCPFCVLFLNFLPECVEVAGEFEQVGLYAMDALLGNGYAGQDVGDIVGKFLLRVTGLHGAHAHEMPVEVVLPFFEHDAQHLAGYDEHAGCVF